MISFIKEMIVDEKLDSLTIDWIVLMFDDGGMQVRLLIVSCDKKWVFNGTIPDDWFVLRFGSQVKWTSWHFYVCGWTTSSVSLRILMEPIFN